MKSSKKIFLAIAIVFAGVVSAQENQEEKSPSRFSMNIGLNAMSVRTGTSFANIVSPDEMNAVPALSTLGFNYSFNYGISLNAGLDISKNLDDEFLTNVSLQAHYDLGQLINLERIAPYVALGVGFTDISANWGITANFGGGVNFWFSDVTGMRIQSLYNHKLQRSDDIQDFYLHSISILFRI